MLKRIKIFCYKFLESLNKITLVHSTVIKIIKLIKEIVSNCKNNFNNNFNNMFYFNNLSRNYKCNEIIYPCKYSIL